MGFRFRKSYKLPGGFRINLSKSGIGYSWGVKGYRITKKANGNVRKTVSVPGTGISHVSESKASVSSQYSGNKTVQNVPDLTNFDPKKAVRKFVLSFCVLFLIACISFSIGLRAYIANSDIWKFLFCFLICMVCLCFISIGARRLAKNANAYNAQNGIDVSNEKARGLFSKCEHCHCTYLSKKISENGYCPQCEQAYQKARIEYIANKRVGKVDQSVKKQKNNNPDQDRPKIFIPEKIDDAPLAYRYSHVPFDPAEGALEIGKRMVESNSMALDPRESGDAFELLFCGELVGATHERADMLHDWIKRGDPLLVYLENLDVDDKRNCFVFMAFYRDEQKRYANNECTVCKLTNFSDEDVQMCVGLADDRERLSMHSEFSEEPEGTVFSDSSAIGVLPSEEKRRYMDGELAAIFLDHTECDDRGLIVPYVKIFWRRSSKK